MPPKEQIFIGAATALLCLIGLVNGRWILDNTKKGQRLTNWFGRVRAIWILRALLTVGAAFGVLLATDFIEPVKW